jgi:hypothetical protein
MTLLLKSFPPRWLTRTLSSPTPTPNREGPRLLGFWGHTRTPAAPHHARGGHRGATHRRQHGIHVVAFGAITAAIFKITVNAAYDELESVT